ncbi:MAG: hypothetical protein RBT33_00820 [Candidatus Dojkabacteria bacterium]|jgi:hypothetical protein|nr:hypothetical protein [Candidatus Dojkabacteria bacterium]MDX9738895.1 hypothetical protein [Candidatus Dojkabacteria bacterium]
MTDIVLYLWDKYMPIIVIIFASNVFTEITKIGIKSLLEKSKKRLLCIVILSAAWSSWFYAGYAFFEEFNYIEAVLVASLTPVAYMIKPYQRAIIYTSNWLANKGAKI